MSLERIDTLEKFRTQCRTLRPHTDGQLNWKCNDGKWLKLICEATRPAGTTCPVCSKDLSKIDHTDLPAMLRALDGCHGLPNERNFWAWRELIRHTERDEDKQVCFADEPWLNPLHFVHVSNNDPMKVAFLPDADKGRRDIYTVTTVGRYLTKYYRDAFIKAVTNADIAAFKAGNARTNKPKDYSKHTREQFAEIIADEKIKALADKHRDKWLEQQVQFTETEEDCERVYTTGPSSCMSHAKENWSLPKHPACVYAGPDTTIAYLTRDGKVTARAVVNKNDNTYARAYGDALLVQKLEKLGYKRDDYALEGVRLKFIQVKQQRRDAFLLPYLDGSCQDVNLVDHGKEKYLEVVRGGVFDGATTGGYALLTGNAYFRCADCEERYEVYQRVHIHGGYDVCQECFEDHDYYADVLLPNGAYGNVHGDNVVTIEGNHYHQDCDFIALGFVHNECTDSWVRPERAERAA